MNYDDWRRQRQRQRRRACCTHIHRHTQQNEAVYYSFFVCPAEREQPPCRAVKLPTYIIIIYITTITFPSFHRERIVARHGEREGGGSHIYILDWDVYVCACKWPCCRLCADHIRIFLLFYLFRGGHQQHDLGDVSSSSSSFFHHFYIIFLGLGAKFNDRRIFGWTIKIGRSKAAAVSALIKNLKKAATVSCSFVYIRTSHFANVLLAGGNVWRGRPVFLFRLCKRKNRRALGLSSSSRESK